MEIYESVYAYLYKNNYAGSTELMEGLYTLTAGAENTVLAALLDAHRKHGSPGLENIDAVRGATLEGGGAADFGLSAYSYLPIEVGGFAMLDRTTLRASLRGTEDLRGHKELTHAVFLELPVGAYAADYAFCSAFDTYTDITLDESERGEGYVCERVPELLPPLDGRAFSSAPIKADNINALGKNNVSIALAALFEAQKQSKTLYVVGKTSDARLVCEYIRTTLKALPANIANGISFITCCDGDDVIKRDVAGVLSSDERLIARLEERGAVLRVSKDGAKANAGACKYAEFLKSEPEKFTECLQTLFCRAKTLDALNGAAADYALDAELERRNSPEARASKLTEARIAFVLRELSLLDGKTACGLMKKRLPPELVAQAYARHGLKAFKPYRDRFAAERLAKATEEAAGEFLRDGNATAANKAAFCAAVKRECDKRNVDFRIKLADASKRLFQSVLLSAIVFVVMAIASALLFTYYADGYFVTAYVAFPLVSVAIGQFLFWYNVRENKPHRPFATAVWQSVTVCTVMLALYVAVQAALSAAV